MNSSIRRRLAGGKGENQYRLRDIEWEDQPRPMFAAGSIKYDLAEKALSALRGTCAEHDYRAFLEGYHGACEGRRRAYDEAGERSG